MMIPLEVALGVVERVLRLASDWLAKEPELTHAQVLARVDAMFGAVKEDERTEWAEVYGRTTEEDETPPEQG